MGRRSEHTKEELRELALRAAENTVVRSGFGGLTMRKVASDIGYTVGSLYMVFRNQDEMILQLNGRTIDELYIDLQRAVDKSRKPETALRAMARSYIDYAHRNPSRWRMAFEHSLPEGEEMPDWLTEKIEKIYVLTRQTVRPLMKKTTEAQVRTAAAALWSGVHGVTILAATNKLDVIGPRSVKKLSDFLIDTSIKGLKKR